MEITNIYSVHIFCRLWKLPAFASVRRWDIDLDKGSLYLSASFLGTLPMLCMPYNADQSQQPTHCNNTERWNRGASSDLGRFLSLTEFSSECRRRWGIAYSETIQTRDEVADRRIPCPWFVTRSWLECLLRPESYRVLIYHAAQLHTNTSLCPMRIHWFQVTMYSNPIWVGNGHPKESLSGLVTSC